MPKQVSNIGLTWNQGKDIKAESSQDEQDMEIAISRSVRQRHKTDDRPLPACVLLFFLLLPCKAFAQFVPPSSAQVAIPDGTPVQLQLDQTISSARARKGDRLDFLVTDDVTVGGFTVIRAGTKASGSVAKIHGRRFLGMGGNVLIKLDSVGLVTGDRVRLHARRKFKGVSHTKLMAEAMLIAGLIYLPAAPVFLLSHGVDCTVLKSTEMTAYIDGAHQVQTAELEKATDHASSLKEILAFLPPRALNGQGREGDMINLIFIAKEDDLQAVFARAGWVNVDKNRPTLFWHLLWQRKHYVKLPMNNFFLFGRSQDYAYALPDPAATLSRRHHLRVWKTDHDVNGIPVWAAAATHDVAIEFKLRKVWMIHRIDPDVDAEREFIARNLTKTNLATRVGYLASPVPVFRAQTATGEAYHSDSRMILLDFSQPLPSEVSGSQAKDHVHVLREGLLSFAK